MSIVIEQKLRGLADSKKFRTAYSWISQLAYGSYGMKRVGDRLFPVNRNGVPLSDDNIEKVLDAPFDGDLNSLREFKNFGEMLQQTVSVFTEIYTHVKAGDVKSDAIERILSNTDVSPYIAYVWPLYLRKQKIQQDDDERKFWESLFVKRYLGNDKEYMEAD
jgi:hypothetical protein